MVNLKQLKAWVSESTLENNFHRVEMASSGVLRLLLVAGFQKCEIGVILQQLINDAVDLGIIKLSQTTYIEEIDEKEIGSSLLITDTQTDPLERVTEFCPEGGLEAFVYLSFVYADGEKFREFTNYLTIKAAEPDNEEAA